MKKATLWSAVAAAAVLAWSCTSEEAAQNEPAREGKPVTFHMNVGGLSRTTTDATSRVTSWKEGDAVGIFVYNDERLSRNNVKYTFDGDRWTSENGIVDTDGSRFYAYYPYSEDATVPTSAALSVQGEQTSEYGYGASDVLAATALNVANPADVVLNYSHKYAMVEVAVSGDLVTAEPASVMLNNVSTTGTINLLDGTCTTTGTPSDVSMLFLGEKNGIYAYRAIVPAQTIAASTPFITVSGVNGKNYQFQYSSAISYEAGKFRTINVNISTEKIRIEIPASNMNIEPWGETGSIGGDGEQVVLNLVKTPLKDVAATDLVTYNNNDAVMSAMASVTTPTWFGQLAAAGDAGFVTTIVDDPDYGKALSYTIDESWASPGSWYKGCAGYFYKTAVPAGWFKLTFKAKSNVAGKRVMVLVRSGHAATQHFFVTHQKRGLYWDDLKEADTWKDFTVYVNTGMITGSTASAPTDLQTSGTTDLDSFAIRFYSGYNAAGKGFTATIADVNMIQVDESEVPME